MVCTIHSRKIYNKLGEKMAYYPTAHGKRKELIYRCGRVTYMSAAATLEKMKEFYNKRRNDTRNKRFIDRRIHDLEGGRYVEER
jgi:hypothetical protein